MACRSHSYKIGASIKERVVMWQAWINFILGIWVIIVPYLNMTESGLKTTLVITGIVIAVLGAWGAIEKRA